MINDIQLITKSTKTAEESTVIVKVGAGKAGQPTVIKAQAGVSYELRDIIKNRAPDQLLFKRKGKDLLILLNAEGKDTDQDQPADIVIENYYGEGKVKLIGLSEDGQYYTYLPQEGTPDLLSWKMSDGASTYQSLGELHEQVAWWPFVLAGLGAGIAAASGGGSDPVPSKDTTPPAAPDVVAQDDGSVTIAPPKDPDVKLVTIDYVDESGTPHTAVITKGTDGTWTSNDPNVSTNPTTGVSTIPEDKVKDGVPVVADATDTSGNTGPEDSDIPKDVTPPPAPDVVAQDDGSVTIAPPTVPDVKTVTIDYVDESGTPHTAVITKGTDGTWTSNDPNVSTNPTTGVSTIPEDKVKDGVPVVADATDTSGNTGPEDSDIPKDVTPPPAPDVVAQDDGSVTIAPPTVPDVKTVTIDYVDESGTPHTAVITKGTDGTWTSNDPNVSTNPTTGVSTIPEDKVKDGVPVVADATDTSGNTGPEDSDIPKDVTPPSERQR